MPLQVSRTLNWRWDGSVGDQDIFIAGKLSVFGFKTPLSSFHRNEWGSISNAVSSNKSLILVGLSGIFDQWKLDLILLYCNVCLFAVLAISSLEEILIRQYILLLSRAVWLSIIWCTLYAFVFKYAGVSFFLFRPTVETWWTLWKRIHFLCW